MLTQPRNLRLIYGIDLISFSKELVGQIGQRFIDKIGYLAPVLDKRLPVIRHDELLEPKSSGDKIRRSDQPKKVKSPENPIQRALVKIWQDLFQKELIGIDDDYFDLGGSSILAIQMFNLMTKELGVSLSPGILFEYPSIEKISAFIQEGRIEPKESSIVSLKPSGSALPLFCIHSGGAHVFFYRSLAKHIDEKQARLCHSTKKQAKRRSTSPEH